jgi:uncharacterized protein YkwD
MRKLALPCLAVLLLATAQLVVAGDAVADPALKSAENARKQLDSHLSFVSSKTLVESYKGYTDAGEAARVYIFDDKKYPVPAKAHTGWVPGKDKQPGHEDMEKLASAAIVRSNLWTHAYCAAIGGSTLEVGEKNPTLAPVGEPVAGKNGEKPKDATIRAVEHYGFLSSEAVSIQFLKSFASDYEKYLKNRQELESKKLGDTPQSENRPLIQAIGELALGHYAAAREAGNKLSSLEAGVFKQLCYDRALNWNRENASGHDTAEAEAMHVINAYRIALNFHPMALNTKLHEMAQDYSNEMARHNFFGHEHPTDATRKTFMDRAKRVGYAGAAGENIAGTENVSAAWMWRADAGHHRNLLQRALEAGLGTVKSSVFNIGMATDNPITLLFAEERKTARKK